jgi:hypothetical protein
MLKKLFSVSRGSSRKVKTAGGGMKRVPVKSHTNRVNRKPRKKK